MGKQEGTGLVMRTPVGMDGCRLGLAELVSRKPGVAQRPGLLLLRAFSGQRAPPAEGWVVCARTPGIPRALGDSLGRNPWIPMVRASLA